MRSRPERPRRPQPPQLSTFHVPPIPPPAGEHNVTYCGPSLHRPPAPFVRADPNPGMERHQPEHPKLTSRTELGI